MKIVVISKIAKNRSMKKGIQILVIFMAFLSISCEKDGLSYEERKLVGTWEYTKVKFTKKWSIKTSDLSSDYRDYELKLREDFTAKYIDFQTGDNYTGLWDLSQICTDEDVVTTVFISLSNDVSGEVMQLIFENATLSKRFLRGVYQSKEGQYRYVLEKK